MNTVAHRIILFPLLFLLLTISINIQITNAATFNALTVQDLTDAINTANTNGEADTINLLSPLFTITGLEPDYPFSDGNGRNGLPIILSDSGNALTINGNRSIIERSPSIDTADQCFSSTVARNFRIFQISTGAEITINNLTMQNGCSTGILNFGQLTLNNSSVLDNIDGGISNRTGATLIVENGSKISQNRGTNIGGGIYNHSGATLDITYSTISNNSANNAGGGIYNQTGGILLPLVGLNISRNTLENFGSGAGIYNGDNGLSIINSTLTSNLILPFNIDPTGSGGAIYQVSTTNKVEIFSSTIVGNSAEEGGGIYADSTTVDFKNTLIANNAGDNCRGTLFSANNLGGNISTVNFVFPNPIHEDCDEFDNVDWNVSQMLGPLQDNGGLTETRELIVTANPVNPAIDTIAAVDCVDLSLNPLTEDQRTFQRPFNTNCDVGATELQPTGKLTIDLTSDPAGGKNYLLIGDASFPEGCLIKGNFFLSDQESLSCVIPPAIHSVGQFLFVSNSLDITCSEPSSVSFSTVTVDIADGEDVTCTFSNTTPESELEIELSGTGSGTVNIDPPDEDCPGSCSHTFPVNNGVALTAVPDANSSFTGWSGDLSCIGTNPKIVVVMDDNIGVNTCTAEFTAELRSLELNKTGDGAGTVASSPAGINCGPSCNSESFDFNLNEIVTLTATPEPGTLFKTWGGNCFGTNPVINVTMNLAKSCTVQFDRESLLTITKAGDGSGMVTSSPVGISCGSDCDETYEMGTFIILNTIPDIGSTFAGWTGSPDCMDGIVMMDTDLSCLATFNQLSAPGFHLLPITPSVAGVNNMLISRDGVPLGDVVFVYGFNQAATDGSSICPGLTLDILNFRVLTTQTADIFGEVVYDIFIPANFAGTSVLIQAVDLTTCMPSGLNSETFADIPMDPPVLDPMNPGTAGVQNTITATGATPNSDVTFTWGFTAQSDPAGNICPGFDSGILNPRILTTVTADGSGNASLNVNVPANFAGISIVLQAVDITTCTGSNVNPETL